MASTPSFLSALATRLPPEIFSSAPAALGVAPSTDLSAARPCLFSCMSLFIMSLAVAKMIRDHPGHAAGDPFACGYVEELVGAVRVRMRAEHPRDQELRLRKALAQHIGERDGAAFTHVCGRFAEVNLRRFLQRSLEPRRERRCIPAAGRPVALEAHGRA